MIAVNDLALQQGNFSLVNVSFTIPTGKYGVLMGQVPAAGKRSVLEAIAGLRPWLREQSRSGTGKSINYRRVGAGSATFRKTGPDPLR